MSWLTVRRMVPILLIGVGAISGSFCAALPAAAYDNSWYQMNGWSGEYPDGFTISTDTTVNMRSKPDPTTPKTIPCLLKRGATYHEWNKNRVKSDHLEFLSFTKTEAYELKSNFITKLLRQSDGQGTVIKFKAGDRWTYLAYGAEGSFFIRFNGIIYAANQNLFEKSSAIGAAKPNHQPRYDEWLKLTCANGAVGWIYFNEIKDVPGISKANILGYGGAEDKFAQMKKQSGTYVVPVNMSCPR